MTEVKLAICMPTAEMARQAVVYDYFDSIIKPTGTLIIRPHGQSPAAGRNLAIEGALANNCTHILFIDDDTVPPNDIFVKLIAHDVDMVTGIYPMRNYPHQPILFTYADEGARCTHYFPPDGVGEGLVPLKAAGLGACLINTRVFKAMPRPWITLGELIPEHWNDDISFFLRAEKHGFHLWGDLSVRCGHFASMLVKNDFIDGKWLTTYESYGTRALAFPLVKPVEELV